MENMSKKREEVKRSISDVLIWVGTAGAVLSSIVYLIITYIMVKGFSAGLDIKRQIIFSIIGSIAGLSIASFLKLQGITFAKKIKENKEVIQEYNNIKNKGKEEKELYTIDKYLMISTIKDVAFKFTTIAASTFFIISIAIEGNGDMMLFALALANLTMFVSFGIISMAKSYDVYNEEHIPAIKKKIELLQEVNNE